MSLHRRSIHWFRRDLRIDDNTALIAASNESHEIIPLYVVSCWTKNHLWTGPARQQYLCDCLASLAHDTNSIGGRLLIRRGPAPAAIRRVIEESGAEALYFNRDPDPFGRVQEEEIRKICEELGVALRSYKDQVLHDENEVLTKGTNAPYRVFTPYRRAWEPLEKAAPQPGPTRLKTPTGLDSEEIPTLATWELPAFRGELPPAGEGAARRRLDEAISNIIPTYQETRDTPAGQTTSRLSQDLRFGTISIRQVYQAAAKLSASSNAAVAKNADCYISELVWREFYMALLAHYPEVLDLEFGPVWRGLAWKEPGEDFEAWKAGRTGFPIVDAGMRQLAATGFMHNRVRMIVAMFLTKDLHLDWRLGEQHFMQSLIDGEIASNNGGWQWSAGTGADAAPYFRIQNPWTQSKRYDPDGSYIRQWIPELADVPAKLLHVAPKDGLPLAPGYPLPIVDHATERDATLARYQKHREQQQ